MNLYLISQALNSNYDTYDAAVVAAETIEEARLTHPADTEWDGLAEKYVTWVLASQVQVELLGIAKEGTPAGVICASFNAG
jgi:hypothetical protein